MQRQLGYLQMDVEYGMSAAAAIVNLIVSWKKITYFPGSTAADIKAQVTFCDRKI
jgi:hypothetical protein